MKIFLFIILFLFSFALGNLLFDLFIKQDNPTCPNTLRYDPFYSENKTGG